MNHVTYGILGQTTVLILHESEEIVQFFREDFETAQWLAQEVERLFSEKPSTERGI